MTHKRRWRVRIDPKRPHQSKIWFDDIPLAGTYCVRIESRDNYSWATFCVPGRYRNVDWLTEEESDELAAE